MTSCTNTEGYIAENVAEVCDLYQAPLRNNAMDFDDLIMQTVALLGLFPKYANATRPGSSTSTWTSTRIQPRPVPPRQYPGSSTS